MPNTIEITHLSKEEKLRLMEAIWEDLTKEVDFIESSEWHRQKLEETSRRLEADQELIKDWQDAKTELRKRFE